MAVKPVPVSAQSLAAAQPGDKLWHFKAAGSKGETYYIAILSRQGKVTASCQCWNAFINFGSPSLCCKHAIEAVETLKSKLESPK